MKTAWNIITLIALANLIAIIGFIWWLHFSGRLDMDRAQEVRTMLSETIAEQAKRDRAQAAAEEEAALKAAEEERLAGAPVSASETLSMRIETSELDLQRLQRLRREVDDIKETLRRERRLFDQERSDFVDERDAFEAMRDKIAQTEGDAQFAKSVAVLDSVKASEAKAILEPLLQDDPLQVVTYLNAMKPRARAGVINQFNKDGQPELAADLLERLRVHGMGAEGQ